MDTSRGSNRRINSLQTRERVKRHNSATARGKRPVAAQDAYLYALRVAYLSYLHPADQICISHLDPPPHKLLQKVLNLESKLSIR